MRTIAIVDGFFVQCSNSSCVPHDGKPITAYEALGLGLDIPR